MDERTLKIVLKFDKDTAGLGAMIAALSRLKGSEGFAGISQEVQKADKHALGFFDRLAGAIPGMRIFGVSLAGELVAGIGAAILGFAPYVAAAIAGMLNVAAMLAILLVGGGALVALAGAFVLLGGGVARTSGLATANNQLAAAAEAHENAVRKLQEGYVAWNSTATHTQLELMRLQDLQERVADTAAKLANVQAKANDAQADVSPMSLKLKADLGGMFDAWRDRMRPGADQILAWIDSLIPRVGAMGVALIDWFQNRLPRALQFFQGIFDRVLGGSNGFGAVIGRAVDYLLSHQAEFIGFFQDVLSTATNVFGWLMNAFVNIHEWFKRSWPGILGFIKAFQDGVGVWGLFLKPILKDIGDRLGDIGRNITILNPLWSAMGAGIGSMVTIALSTLAAVLEIISAIIAGLKWIEGHRSPNYQGYWSNDGRGHRTWHPGAQGNQSYSQQLVPGMGI